MSSADTLPGVATVANYFREAFPDFTPGDGKHLNNSSAQTITAAGVINVDKNLILVTGPSSSTYAITLAAPNRSNQTMVIKMVSTTSTNAVTLALTNVIGGSAATTATFNAADETLVLISSDDAWCVVSEAGVTLS